MKNLTISHKITEQIKEILRTANNLDSAYEYIVGLNNLFGVAFFGHGSKHQKYKCELIWRNILFIAYDFKEYNRLVKGKENEIKNYLSL